MLLHPWWTFDLLCCEQNICSAHKKYFIEYVVLFDSVFTTIVLFKHCHPSKLWNCFPLKITALWKMQNLIFKSTLWNFYILLLQIFLYFALKGYSFSPSRLKLQKKKINIPALQQFVCQGKVKMIPTLKYTIHCFAKVSHKTLGSIIRYSCSISRFLPLYFLSFTLSKDTFSIFSY